MLGGMPVVPHANTSHYDGIGDDQFWLDGTMQLLRRCDAMVCLENWKASSGARAEHEEAVRRGMPIFYDLAQLDAWLKSARELAALGVENPYDPKEAS